jgi:hypothetical protein
MFIQTALAIYKCILDIFFVQQFLWVPFISNSAFFDDDASSSPYYCNASFPASIWAFCTQFFLLSGELCFLVISMDLRMAYTNPFTSFESTKMFYICFILGSALLTSVCLLIMGNHVYGPASEGIIWIQDRRALYSPNYAKMLLFYLPVCLVNIYCLWATIQFQFLTERGLLGQTLRTRITIMQRSRRYTLSYVLYDSTTLLLEFVSFTYSDSKLLNSLPAYAYACRGLGSLCILLYANYPDLTWENLSPWSGLYGSREEDDSKAVLEGLLLQPHLNVALRVEILYFTTLGITHAALEVEKEEEIPIFNSNNSISGPDNCSITSTNSSTNRVHNHESRCYSYDEHPSLGIR